MGYTPYPDYRTIDPGTLSLRLAVSAIVRDEAGRAMLQKRGDNGYWGFPGGKVEPGETVEAAIVREVHEETGYTIRPTRLIGIYSDPANHQIVRYPKNPERTFHFVVLFFEATLLGGKATLCDETVAIAWHHPDALPEPFVPAHRIRLTDTLADQEAAFFR